MSSRWSKCEKLGCATRNWHQQEHQGLGSVTYPDTSKNTKAWAVSHTLTPVRIPRLGLWHNRRAQEHQDVGCVTTNGHRQDARIQSLGRVTRHWQQQEYQDSTCVTRHWQQQEYQDSTCVTRHWQQQEYQDSTCVTRHWQQQEYQDSTCVTKQWHQKEHHGLSCHSTLTPARIQRHGLCHLHWHQ